MIMSASTPLCSMLAKMASKALGSLASTRCTRNPRARASGSNCPGTPLELPGPWIDEDGHTGEGGPRVLQHLQPFARQFKISVVQPGDVAARPVEACHQGILEEAAEGVSTNLVRRRLS